MTTQKSVCQLLVGSLNLFCVLLWCGSALAQPTERVPGKAAEIPGLYAIDVKDTAVTTTLKPLAQESHVPLRAQKAIEDYRISAFTTRVPLARIMDDLGYLFDHAEAPVGFYWKSDDVNPNGYLLTRTQRSIVKEQQMPDEVKRLAGRWVKECWQAFNLKGAARTKAEAGAISPAFSVTGPDFEDAAQVAFSLLTESEINRLAAGDAIQLPLNRFPLEIAQNLRKRATRKDGSITDTNQDLQVKFALRPSGDARGAFHIALETTPINQNPLYGMLFDPLGAGSDIDLPRGAKFLDPKGPSPVIDLKEAEKASKDPYDLNARLRVIARVAKVNIYLEYFPAPSASSAQFTVVGGENAFNFSHKAPLHTLLNEVANVYHLNIARRGDSYFLWSRIWFQERPNIIPDALLTDWRATQEKGGPFRFDQLLTMVQLSEGQSKMMQRMDFAVNVDASDFVLRLLTTLAPAQRQSLFLDEGLPFAALTQEQRNNWLAETSANNYVGRWSPHPNDPGTIHITFFRLEDRRPAIKITLRESDGSERTSEVTMLWNRYPPKPK